MPHPRVCAARHLLARALPWVGLLALSMTLAEAMNVGLTGGAHGAGGLSSPQSLPWSETHRRRSLSAPSSGMRRSPRGGFGLHPRW